MIDTYITKLAEFYTGVRYCDIPNEVIAKARRAFVDFLACLAAGAKEGELARIWNAYVVELGGRAESTLLCVGERVPALNAAPAMAIMGHSIELDDGHRWGTAHPAVAVIPAIIAVGEREESSFKEIITATIIGYDAMLRTARAINPAHLKRGFHSTGTCGCIGAATGCAHLLHLDAERTGYAMAIGGLQSAGIQEMLHDHPNIKALQPGKAAMAGVISADLARLGAKGPRTMFEGIHGWLKAMCSDEYSEAAIIGDLGQRWELMYTYTKLYPTCRHCHAAIDLAREAKCELQCTIEQIDKIEIKTYTLGNVEVGQIVCPSSFEEAMFSMPFSVAIALDRGNVRLSDFTAETLSDERLRRLAKKIFIYVDEEMDAKYPEERGAWMNIQLHDGRTFVKGIPLAKGEPEISISDSEHLVKLQGMLTPHYPSIFLDELWDIVIEHDIDSVHYQNIIKHFRSITHADEKHL